MDPSLLLSVAAGGMNSLMSFAEPLFNFGLGQASSKKQFKYQKHLMEMQHAWAEKMRATAHQTEVQDLRAAGLNPILSAMNGSGAVTPSAPVPTVPSPDYGEVNFSGVGDIGEKIRSVKLFNEQLANAKKEGINIDARTARENAETVRILKHAAEGVGVPKQTQNVVLNMLNYAKDNLEASAKGIRDVEKESLRYQEGWRNEEKMKKQLERQMLIKQMRRDVDPNFTLD